MAAMFCLPWVSKAQSLSDYRLTVDTTTFTSIVSTGTAISLSTTDDGNGTCTVPFAFPFGESNLPSNNQLSISANGFICLTGSASGTYAQHSNTAQRIINALINQDAHMGRYSGSGVYYQVDTVDGVQCITIEFHLLGRYSSPYGVYSHQVKLFANGNIQFIYDSVDLAGSTTTLRTFFWDGPENELVMVSGDWATPDTIYASNAVTRPNTNLPVHGLRYTFTRPTISCPKPMELLVSDLQAHSLQLNWTTPDTLSISEWDIRILSATDSSLNNTHLQSYEDSIALTGLMAGTSYTFSVRAICGYDDTSLYRTITTITPCEPIPHDSLPYVENFESYNTGSSSPISPCWTKAYMQGGTLNYASYPYVTTTGGTKSLYFYGYSTSYYSWAVLPPFEDSLNTLAVSFKLYKTSDSYGSIELGIMDDPNDMSTWHPIATRQASRLSTWEPFLVSLASYSGTGFIAFRQSSTYYTYLDDVVVDVQPTCAPIASVTASNIAATSAFVQWRHMAGVAPNDPTEYEIEYYSADDSPTSFTDTNNFALLTGLSMGTEYTVRVRCVCDGSDYGSWDSVTFTTSFCPTSTFIEISAQTLSTSSSTSEYNPTNGCYEYSYTQQIYDSTLLSGVSEIYGVSFNVVTTAATTRDVQVYLGTTTQSTFTSMSNYIPLSQLTLMGSALIDCTQEGWTTISFDSAFTYTGGNLVVAMDDNTGSYYCSPAFASHYSTGYTTIYYYQDETNISPSNPSADDEEYLSNRPDIRLVMQCDSNATCIPPNMMVASVTSDEATLIWAPGGSESSWVLEYRAVGNPMWSVPEVVTSSPYLLTGLTPNTNYEVRLGNDCGDTILYAVANFVTACGPMMLPFHEGFDTWSSNVSDPLPNCWYKQTNYSSNYPYASTSYNHTPGGSKAMYMYSTGTTWSYMVLPEFAAPVDSLQLRFWLYKSNSSYNHRLIVGVVTDPTDETTFVPVDTVMNSALSTWEEFSIPLDRYTGPVSGAHIAIMSPNSEYSYPYLDDLTVERIPDCPAVDNLAAINVTTDEADIVWDELGDATSWTVEWGPSGFTIGTGTVVYASDTVVNLTGLTPNTAYDVYVAPDCPDGVPGVAYLAFHTACGGTPVPFHEGFDTWSSNTSDPLPDCWYKKTNYSTNYPYASTSYNHSPGGSKSMYMYSTSTTWSYMVLPEFATPIDSLQVSFWLYKTSTSYNHRLIVGVITNENDETTFVPVDTVMNSALSTWEEFTVIFTNYADTIPGARIAIMSPNNEYSYPYLDDLTVEIVPDCLPVDSLTLVGIDSNMISITWTEQGDATSWTVEYGPHGFTPGTGTTVTVTAVPFTATGLTPNTEYDFYITPDCASGVAGVETITVRTANTYIAPPFICNFEDTVQNRTWTLENGSVANKWYIGTAASNGGTQGLYISNTNGTTNNYDGASSSVAYAYVDLMLTAGEYGYNYDWKCNGESSFDFLRAALVPVSESLTAGASLPSGLSSTSMPSTWISMDGDTRLNLSTSWQTQSDVFTVPTTGVYHMTFVWRNDGSVTNQPPIAIDNVEFVRSVCPRPDNVTIDNLTQTSADFSWSETGSATEWQYQLGSGTIQTVYDTNVTITGLSANSAYTFKVRSVCDSGTTSFWRTVSFRTPCGVITLPYTEDFETAATSSSTTGSAFVDCWYRLNNGTSYGGYPYVSSSSTYNHTSGGTKGLYWYNTTTTGTYGDYQVVVLPPVDSATNANTLQVSFWAKASSASYVPVFKVGVMTDPNDVTTFVGLDTITIVGTTWQLVEVPLYNYTGSGSFVAVKADRPTSSWYAYVDDFTLDYIPTCVAPRDVHASDATTTTLTVDWTDITPAMSWDVEYGPQGYTRGSSAGTALTTTIHPLMLTGLDSLSSYDIYVRPICGMDDTGRWSAATTLTTTMCDNFDGFTIGSASSGGTTYYAPLNNFYNYTLTETIIDSAEIGGPMDIEYIGYYYDYSSPSTVKTNCTIYFQPTTLSTFSSTSSMVALDTATAVMVYTGSLNCSQGWNYFPLSSVYSYSGTGNLLIIVDDNSYDYDGSSYVFRTEPCSGNKTIYYYSDSSNPDPLSPTSFSGNTGTATWRVVTQLVSCSGVSCPNPIVTSETHDYQSATITWSGSGSSYEVNIKETAALDWPSTDIAVTGNTYTFSGLNSETAYTYRVRQDCSADSAGYSDWVEGGFVTDSLPCLTPSDLAVSDLTNAQGTFSWVANGNETVWELHVWNTGVLDTVYRVTTNPATVGGFTAGVTYNAAVRPLCGALEVEGDYSAPITFTTLICPDVTGLATSNVTYNSVTLNWTADPMAEGWMIEYGYMGFAQGTGTNVTVQENSYVANGLEDETPYDFYVKAICGEDWNSEGWTRVSATTQTADNPTYTVTVTVTDATMGTATGGGTYQAGQSCTVTATANSGYRFVNWSNGETANPYTFTVVSNITLTANFESVQGIEEVSGDAVCTIYPNPTSDVTTISVSGVNGKVRIAVVDMNGRTVASETLECSSDCEKTMDVDQLAQGAYFVRITGDNVNMVKKLVVR